MTPAGIEPSTFRCVAQHPNHCATAVPSVCGYFHIVTELRDKIYLNGPKSIHFSVRTDNVTVNFSKSASLLRLLLKKQKPGPPAETTLPRIVDLSCMILFSTTAHKVGCWYHCQEMLW